MQEMINLKNIPWGLMYGEKKPLVLVMLRQGVDKDRREKGKHALTAVEALHLGLNRDSSCI